MKAKVTNQWILNFNALRGYLNLVSKETNKPIYALGRDATYAIARTGKKVKDDVELMTEKDAEFDKQQKQLEAAVKTANGDDGTAEQLLADFKKQREEEWEALLDTEVEVEVHKFQLADLPKDVNMPEGFMETLDTLIIEPEE